MNTLIFLPSSKRRCKLENRGDCLSLGQLLCRNGVYTVEKLGLDCLENGNADKQLIAKEVA